MTKKYTGPVLLIGMDADVRYASGFAAVDPVVLLDERGKKTLVVPALEVGRARQTAARVDVCTPQELAIPMARRRRVMDWAVAILRQRNIRRVAVPPAFPASALRRLERSGIRVRVLEDSPYSERAIKKSGEIEMIRAVQGAAVDAMRQAIRVIAASRISRDGYLLHRGRRLTAESVREIIEITLLKHTCSGRDTIVAGGVQAADPHGRGEGPLRAGEAIVIDIFPQHKRHGYWGDITRTVVRGGAPEQVKKMYRAVLHAQQIALSRIRAGARGHHIHREVQQALEQAGFVTAVRNGRPSGFIHGTGHGVGLEIHEAPSLSSSEAVLRAGNVVTVEPGLYYAECGGVRIEDTVLVTKRGYQYLAAYSKRLEI
jgi:Xaa-Pro aminopeptidase